MTGKFAITKNVRAFHAGLEVARHGVRGRVGMMLVKGSPGTGKTEVAQQLVLEKECPYIRCRFIDSPRSLLERVVRELGEEPRFRKNHLFEQARNQLVTKPRVIIFDEIDYIVNERFIDVIRDLNDETNNLIVLVGEEHIDKKLQSYRRFFDRIKIVVPFDRFDRADIVELSKQSCSAPLASCAIDHIHQFSDGTFRLIAEMFELAERLATHNKGVKEITGEMLAQSCKKRGRR